LSFTPDDAVFQGSKVNIDGTYYYDITVSSDRIEKDTIDKG